jgi:hypothetical protein
MIGFWKFMAHRCPAAAELGRSAAEGARVADADKPEVVRPADDVTCWLEKDSSVMLKAVTRFGDSVELVADDARAIAAALVALADRLEPLPDKHAEPGAAPDGC